MKNNDGLILLGLGAAAAVWFFAKKKKAMPAAQMSIPPAAMPLPAPAQGAAVPVQAAPRPQRDLYQAARPADGSVNFEPVPEGSGMEGMSPDDLAMSPPIYGG